MVQGIAEFERRWKAIPQRVRTAAKEELEAQAERIVREMRRAAPKKEQKLARSINWTWGDAPAGSLILGTVGGNDYGTLRITIYAGDETTIVTNSRGMRFQNAIMQEHGTKKMPANPYFYPVWRTRRRSVRSRVTRAINAAIKSA